MQQEKSKVLDNRSAGPDMADAIMDEMNGIVRAAMEPWRPGDSVKAALVRAHRALGISYRRARSFYYQEPVAILAYEADRLRVWRRDYVAREIAAAEIRLTALKEQQGALKEKIDAMGLARKNAGMAVQASAVSIGHAGQRCNLVLQASE